MARKRGKGKGRGKRKQPLHKQFSLCDDPEALILDQLRHGKGRKALDLVRQARKAGSEHISSALEFCALMARARELHRSGNRSAAEEMEQRAAVLGETIALPDVPPRHVTEFIRYVNPASAVETYLDIVSGSGTVPDAERALAYHIVCARTWASLDRLDSRHALRSDLPAIREAVRAMDIGDWDTASASLNGIGTRSPYAPWRMFCIAMQQLEKNDRISLARTLSYFPPDFPLVKTIDALKAYAGDTGHGTTDTKILAQLGLYRQGNRILHRSDRLEWFRAAVEDGFKSKAILQVAPVRFRRLAESLVPGSARWAEKFIYDIFILTLQNQADGPENLLSRLMNERSPPRSMALAMDRMMVRRLSTSESAWNPDHVTFYLNEYKADFSNRNDQRLARSILLAELARNGPRCRFHAEEFEDEIWYLSEQIGKELSPENLEVDLLEASIEEDPDHKPGYEALIELLMEERNSASKVEDVYLRMAARFPDDVEPLISMAQSLYRRKAYRRAEKVVARALEVSPDNPRILNLKAVGHLISSDQGRKHGRIQTAVRDHDAAVALSRDIDSCVLAQKRLFLDLNSKPDSSRTTVLQTLEGRAEADQLRILALQLKDLNETRTIKTYREEQRETVQSILDRKIDGVRGLESRDILSLLSRVPEDAAVLYQDSKVASHIRSHWSTMLEPIVSDRVVYAYDILLECRGRDEILADVGKRIWSSDTPPGTKAILGFYRSVLLFSIHGSVYLPSSSYFTLFEEFINEQDAQVRARLAAAAKRLSPYFTGTLGRWLEQFDQI